MVDMLCLYKTDNVLVNVRIQARLDMLRATSLCGCKPGGWASMPTGLISRFEGYVEPHFGSNRI